MKYPTHLLKLIDVLKKLPGVGNKSAERFAFQLLTWPQERLQEMAEVIQEVPLKLQHCKECGCLVGDTACVFCMPSRSSSGSLCIIASARDAFSIEATREYKGLYHVLGGVLSPIDGFNADRLTLTALKQRILRLNIRETIIALDSTLEGDATALYIKQELEPLNVSVTRLAFGLPMGSALDYVDGGTLAKAFSGRASF